LAIRIKAVERPQPGVAGGGVKKIYASPIMDREVTLENLTKAIEKTSTQNLQKNKQAFKNEWLPVFFK
jgi:hypothetical protein